MKLIDVETWNRREYFKAYQGTDFPYINIGAELDITQLLAFSKHHGLSSYLSMIHVAHMTALSIENFRYRIKGGVPVELETMLATFTHLPSEDALFINVTPPFSEDPIEFNRLAKDQIQRQGIDPCFTTLKGRLDHVLYSAIPWVQYTHFVRSISRAGVDSNPKISWGKYFKRDGRTLAPFSLQVHHGLMDGHHVGHYFEQIQARIHRL